MHVMAIRISALFNPKARLWLEGRKDIFNKIKNDLQDNKNIVWFHCASLGEFEQGKPIIEAYKSKYKNHKILITFFSPSGFEAKKNTACADWVFYLPADTRLNAKRFIAIVKPIKAVFIKYEFWINYMKELKTKNIPFYSISTVFRKQQLFFKYNWWGKQLKNVTHFCLQDKESADLLHNIGVKSYSITGDSRFDNVLANQKNPTENSLIELFCKNRQTIICGSTWPKDEVLLIDYIKKNPQYNYIIAPHEIDNISKLQKETKGLLFSDLDASNMNKKNVLIINTIGILSNIYRYANIAYIGGGFGKGIHNILEPVAFGLPVIFGPKYQKSNEATALIEKKGAISVSNYTELDSAIQSFKNFDTLISFNYIKENSGVTEKVISLL